MNKLDTVECRLCTGLSRPDPDFWDQALFHSDHFLAIPSLGALVEGWLLIVTRRHFVSIGAMPERFDDELESFTARVCGLLSRLYGDITLFEHGPSASSRLVGCGVDHAHLHLVPLKFDLASTVSRSYPDLAWSSADVRDRRAAFDDGMDYLYLEQPFGVGRLASANNFGSQIFRKAIATEIGQPDKSSWREYSQLQNVICTIATIEQAKAQADLISVAG